LILPNVFSPNGDGINESFEIKLLNVEVKSFKIYNRWGIEILKPDNLSMKSLNVLTWDGRTTSGVECSEGVYYYTIEIKNQTSEIKNYRGYISLVR
jgi:gliding motility-associated-like protein